MPLRPSGGLRQAWRELTSRSLVRRTGFLVSGAVVGQVALLISLPIVSRLYDPEDIGLFAVFVSIVGVLYSVSSLRLETAIALPEDERDADALLALVVLVVFATSLASLCALWIFGDPLFEWLDASALSDHVWMIAACTLFAGLAQGLSFMATRVKDDRELALSRAGQGVGTAVVQVALGFVAASVTGLLWGAVVGWGVAVVLLPNSIRRLRAVGDFGAVRRAGRRYRHFPVLGSASALCNRAALEAPPLLISALYDVRLAGFYLVAFRVVIGPSNMLINAAYQVFLGEASVLARSDRAGLRHLYLRTIRRGLQLTIPVSLLIVALAPLVVRLVLGETWATAGDYARAIGWTLPMVVAGGSVGSIFAIVNRLDLQLVRDLARFGAVVLGVVAVHALGGTALEAVYAASAAMAGGYLLLLVLGLREIDRMEVVSP